MGLSFRKSLRFGPVRLNVSTAGVGLSAGVRGARVSFGPRGTYVTLSAGGFQYRRKLDDRSAVPQQVVPPPAWSPTSSPQASAHGLIPTVSVAFLQQTSPDHLAREIERCAARADLFTPYAIGAGVLLLLMLLTCEAWATGLVLLVLLGGGFAIRRWNEERRTVRLVYDVDDPAAMDRFALASVIGEALASSAALWHVHREVSTSDARRNAGAKKLVSRTRTHCTRGAIPPIETNIEPWSISAGPQRLLFLPDRLLLFEGNRVAALPYEYLGASAEPSPMIEDGHVPPDAQQVSTTWRYVRNDGGPDLRFRDNRQLPVLRYGELTIGSGHGVRIVLQMSHAEAAPRAAQALETLAATARAYAAPTAFTPAAVSPPSPAAHAPPRPPTAMPGAPAWNANSAGPQPSPVGIMVGGPASNASAAPAGASSSAPDPAGARKSGGTIAMAPLASPAPGSPSPAAMSGGAGALPLHAVAPSTTAAVGHAPELPPSEARRPGRTVVMTEVATPPSTAPRTAPAPASIASNSMAASHGPWIPPGRSITVAGYTISSGMLYIGENLPPVRGVSSVEPALIQPRLPVDGARPNRAGEGMPYWPAYGEITPAQRAAYLEWLAGGRSDPAAYIGYVFLFFYGIERRILGDSRRWPVSPEERDAIYEEVRRLLGLHSTNNSFRGYATAFLGALWMTSDVRVYERCQPPTEPTGMELPLLLRLGLGQLARDEQPIPAEWALSWLFCDPDYRQLTPARRCFDEFRELFRIRYSQVFKTGMTLKPGTRALSASYRPASASFGGEITLTSAGATDVTGRKKPLEKIREVADRCASDLDAYSRWIGRNPERRGSIAAVGLLPSDLLATHRSDDVDKLCAMLEQHLESKPIAVAPASILATSKPVKAETVATLQLLQKKGYGIEPDVRFGGEVPAAEGKLIVFRLPGDSPTAASPEYRGCALLLHLATVVAAADGEISASELTHIKQRAESMPNLSTAERLRLSAHVRWLVEQPRSPAGLRKRMANLSATQRDGVADFIVAVAGADGRIEAAEVKTLTKLFPILGLDASEVYRRLHALSGAQSTPADVPVSVRPATASRGYAIPPPPSSGAPIVVDMKRVEAKIAETSAVAALLGSIFTGDDDAEPQPTETGINGIPNGAPSQSVAVPPVRNLSAAQSAFVRRLGERMSWARVDVEMLAAELGVMTDGALEAVNEAAFDACGAAVWSGDDPIEMDADVMKELCA